MSRPRRGSARASGGGVRGKEELLACSSGGLLRLNERAGCLFCLVPYVKPRSRTALHLAISLPRAPSPSWARARPDASQRWRRDQGVVRACARPRAAYGNPNNASGGIHQRARGGEGRREHRPQLAVATRLWSTRPPLESLAFPALSPRHPWPLLSHSIQSNLDTAHMAPPPFKTTPPRFAADLTNHPRPSTSSSAKRPSASATTYRQTSLADSRFFRSSSPAPALPSSPSPSRADSADASSVFGSDAPCASDASATSPIRVEDGAHESDDDDDDDKENAPGRTKRRRVASAAATLGVESESASPSRGGAEWAEWGAAQLVGTYGTGDAKGKERMEPTFVGPGQQFSAFEASRRRELGFRAGRAQRASCSRSLRTDPGPY